MNIEYLINLVIILNSISKEDHFKAFQDKLIELFFINDIELLYINDMKPDFSKPFNIPSSNEFYFLSHLLDGTSLPFKLIECFFK